MDSKLQVQLANYSHNHTWKLSQSNHHMKVTNEEKNDLRLWFRLWVIDVGCKEHEIDDQNQS